MSALAGGFIDEHGAVPLPWLEEPLARLLAAGRGHALLLRAAPGVGAFELALCLAQSRLCEMPAASGLACGRCASCRLVHSHAHPDLLVLLPEILRRERGWLLADDKAEGEEAKRKPSRQIRIDEVRSLVDWVTKTSARGRGKEVVLHPAEALNLHAASALLKTVEEPPAGTRLVLTCSDALHVMPTVRSRCQQWALPPLDGRRATGWLEGQGVQSPAVLLDACDGQPLEVLNWKARGVDSDAWAALPGQLAAGRAGLLAAAGVAQSVEVLLKLCHDLMVRAHDAGEPRYFPKLPPAAGISTEGLVAWRSELLALARAAEHPWHEALALDALVGRAQQVLDARH